MGAALSLGLGIGLAAAGACAAKPKPNGFVVPEGKKFIDLLNTDVPTDDATDMSFRFRDGPRIPPHNAEVLDKTVMKPWADDMEGLFDRFLSAYTLGPKPLQDSIPIYVIDESDINCIIQTEDSDDPNKQTNTEAFGFFDVAKKAPPPDPRAMPAADGTAAAPALPARLELRCTELALEDIGDPADPSKGRDEIAFILAHELSHVLLGHFKRAEAQLKHQQDLNRLLHIGATVLTLANSHYHQSGNTIYVTPTKQAGKDVTKLFLATYLINEYNVAIAGPKWAREQEEQADLMAIDLIHMLPQGDPNDPNRITDAGAPVIINKLAETEKKLNAGKPGFAEQLATLMANTAIANAGQGRKNMINAMGTQAAIFAFQKWHENATGHVHDDSGPRTIAIANYISARYPVSAQAIDFTKYGAAAPTGPTLHYPDPAKLRSGAWNGQAFKTAALPQVLAGRLLNELAKGNCDDLAPDLNQFVTDEQAKTDRTQQENFALGSYDLCEAKWDDAIPLFRAAAQGPQAKASFYLSLIQTEQFRGHDADALTDITEAETRAPPKNQYLPLKISSLMALKRTDEAKAAATDCKTNQDQDLGAACMASAGMTYDGDPLPKPDDGTGQPGGDTTKNPSAVDFLKGLMKNSKTAPATGSSGAASSGSSSNSGT